MDFRNLLLRLTFGIVLAGLSLVVLRSRLLAKYTSLTPRRFDQLYLIVFISSHVVLSFVAFFILHQKPHADLPAFYMPEAHSVLNGLVPYRDFRSSYAPLNSYLDALLLRMHDSPMTIIAFQIVCDIASVPFWMGFLRRYIPETTVRKAALLFMLQPLVLWETCLDGKNNACISLLLAITLYAIARREILSGLSYGLSLVVVKILPLMFLPALFFGARNRAIWLASALALPILVYGAFLLHGVDVTEPLRVEGNMSTSGNLPYFLSAVIGHTIPVRLLNGICLLGIAAAVVISIWAQRRAQSCPQRLWSLALSILFLLFTLLVLSKKSFSSYLGMSFFPLCAFTAVKSQGARNAIAYVYALMSCVMLPAESFWFWPMHNATGVQLHERFLSGDPNSIIMLGSQALLLFCYTWFMSCLLRELLNSKPEGLLQPE